MPYNLKSVFFFSLFRLFEECFQRRWYRTAACYILVRNCLEIIMVLLLLLPLFSANSSFCEIRGSEYHSSVYVPSLKSSAVKLVS